jgi:multidrug resistance efflux pump
VSCEITNCGIDNIHQSVFLCLIAVLIFFVVFSALNSMKSLKDSNKMRDIVTVAKKTQGTFSKVVVFF